MIAFQVKDMTCGHCAATITKAITTLDSGARVDIDLENHGVRIDSQRPAAELEAAIRAAGYTPAAPA